MSVVDTRETIINRLYVYTADSYCVLIGDEARFNRTHVKASIVKGSHAMERMQTEQDQKGLNSDIQE